MTMMKNKNSAKKIESGIYLYRGVTIYRHHNVPPKYWNAWTSREHSDMRSKYSGGTKKEIMQGIDLDLDIE